MHLVSGVPSHAHRLLTRLLAEPEPRGGLRLRAQLTPEGSWPPVVPRLGLRFFVPGTGWRATWFGTGPTENYADLTAGCRLGWWRADSVDELWAPTVRPQEAGHRAALRFLRLSAPDGVAVELRTRPAAGLGHPGFSLARWSAEQITAAQHVEELPASDGVWLIIDALHHGIGTRSCGPGVRPDAIAWTRPVELDLTLRVVV